MRNVIFAFTLLLSCNFGYAQTAQPKAIAYDTHKLEGYYTGDFSGSAISVKLEHVTTKLASGYNVHKSIKTTMMGTVHQAGATFAFQLSEPGTGKYDGKFDFTIDTATLVLSGTWTPLSNKDLKPTTFTLTRLK